MHCQTSRGVTFLLLLSIQTLKMPSFPLNHRNVVIRLLIIALYTNNKHLTRLDQLRPYNAPSDHRLIIIDQSP